jgi:hypothetical protein
VETVSKHSTFGWWDIDGCGVMIVALKNAPPVYILKTFGECLLGYAFNEKPDKEGFEEYSGNDYCVFWKNNKNEEPKYKPYEHVLPEVLNEGQKELIENLVKQAIPTSLYISNMLNNDIIELPIDYILKNDLVDIASVSYVSPFRELLKDIKFTKETRKRHLGKKAKIRRQFVADQLRILEKTKPKISSRVEYIYNKWTQKVDTLGWSDKYYFDSMQIWRDIKYITNDKK